MGKPTDIAFIVTTVDRSPRYFHATLASLFASGAPEGDGLPEVHLVVGIEIGRPSETN